MAKPDSSAAHPSAQPALLPSHRHSQLVLGGGCGHLSASGAMGQPPTAQQRSDLQKRVDNCPTVVIHTCTHSSPIHSRVFMLHQHWKYSSEQEDVDHGLIKFSWGGEGQVNKYINTILDRDKYCKEKDNVEAALE